MVVQALSLGLFTLLFALANYWLPDWLPADIYLRLDPLLGLSAVLTGREWIGRALAGVILLFLTALVGRFFCAYVCPLGAVLDFLDPVLFRRTARPTIGNDALLRKVKYVTLIAFFGAAAIGVSLVHFLDPIAILTRTFTFVFYPAFIALANLGLDVVRPLARAMGWMTMATLSYPQPIYYQALLTLAIFAGIVGLSRWTARFWCRYLCPLGALLSLLSPLGRLRRTVGPECPACGLCQDACPMAAAVEGGATRVAECIQCQTCVTVCQENAIAFPIARQPIPIGEYTRIDLSRRGFLYSVAGGVGLGFLVRHTPAAALQGKRQLIRPPGALPEAEFLRTCIRCGECMKACVTNTLQPCVADAGLEGIWTPKMELRFAACEQNCNVCGKVCPTQAIRSLSLDEKNHAKVGTAILKKESCLVWAQDKLCLICDEICPYNAIVFRTIDGYRRPIVIPSHCNGCGFCETRCPVQGDSAIVVVPHDEIRLKTGSYVTEATRLQLDFTPDPGDDRFILERERQGGEGAPGQGSKGERGNGRRGEGEQGRGGAEAQRRTGAGRTGGKPRGFL
jgi:polyferredoxin